MRYTHKIGNINILKKRAGIFLAILSLVAQPLYSVLTNQAVSASTASAVVYDSLLSTSPVTNYPSWGMEAHNFSEFGNRVMISSGVRDLSSVDFTLSSHGMSETESNVTWCAVNPDNCTDEGFIYPITANVYDNTLTNIASTTQDVFVPWRPAGNPECGTAADGRKGWMTNGVCHDLSAIAFNASFDFSAQNITLPDDVVFGIAYNTTTKGYSPTGVISPADSLNVALRDSITQPATVGVDHSTGSFYAAYAGAPLSAKNWGPAYNLAIRVNATAPVPPAPSKLEWRTSGGAFVPSGGATNSLNGTASWVPSTQAGVTYTYTYWNDIEGNQHKKDNRYELPNLNGLSQPGAFNQGQGTHYMQVFAVSAAGIRSAGSNIIAIEYDTTKPTAVITTPTTDGEVVRGTVDITGAITDGGTGRHWFEVKGPNGYELTTGTQGNNDASNWTYTWNTSGLSGQYSIRYVATDRAGNRSDAPNFTNSVTRTVIVDNSPILTVTPSADGRTFTGVVTGDYIEDSMRINFYALNPNNTAIRDENGNQVTLLTGTPQLENGQWTYTIADGDLPKFTIGQRYRVVARLGNSTFNTSENYTFTYQDPVIPTPVEPGDGDDETTTPGGNTSGNQGGSTNQGTNLVSTTDTDLGTTAITPAFTTFAPLLIGNGIIGATATPTDTGDVLGADTNGDVLGAVDNLAQTAANQADGNGLKLFGVDWYWILLVLATVSGLWWIIAGKRRKNEEQA